MKINYAKSVSLLILASVSVLTFASEPIISKENNVQENKINSINDNSDQDILNSWFLRFRNSFSKEKNFAANEIISENDVDEKAEKKAKAAEEYNKILTPIRFYGFVTGRASYTDQLGKYNNMDIRFLRLNGAGDISKSFSYRFQLEFVDDPRILDAYLTWHKYKPFQIRVGQMKRNFTYENKLSPAALGLSEFSMVIQKLTGFSDRVGEHACGGRDIGFIFMGDLFKIKDFHFLHYDLGIFNGNGINKADNNKSKDIIASLNFRPIKNLQFGAGFWDGEFGPEGTTVDRKRWTTGFRYEDPKYLLSAEYIYSKGQRINSDKVIFGADHSDGWYITGGFPVYKNIKIYGKYDVYRDDRTNNTKSEKYIGAINFKPHKNLLFQVSYVYNNLYDIDSYNNVVGQVFFTF